MKMIDLNYGMRQFSSEFSLVSALNGLRALAALRHSGTGHDRKLIEHMIKDAAIIQQKRGALGAYQRLGSSRSYATAQR